MKTRYMPMEYYGISKEERKYLEGEARKKENEALVRLAAEASNEGLAENIYISLTTKESYYHMFKRIYVYAKADDFYAYKRRALWWFKSLLKEKERDNYGLENYVDKTYRIKKPILPNSSKMISEILPCEPEKIITSIILNDGSTEQDCKGIVAVMSSGIYLWNYGTEKLEKGNITVRFVIKN